MTMAAETRIGESESMLATLAKGGMLISNQLRLAIFLFQFDA
jgi:hypothetical protein